MSSNPSDNDALLSIKPILARFLIDGDVQIAPYGSGHIHDTYHVEVANDTTPASYIIQRINSIVFKRIPELIDNMRRVTLHIRNKFQERQDPDVARCTLRMRTTEDGNYFYLDNAGNYWRVCDFIPDALTYDVVLDAQHAYEAGRAFAQFQMLLTDLPPPPLIETIPLFHHTPSRFAALEEAASLNSSDRVEGCAADIDFAMSRRDMIDVVSSELENGILPLRTTHNDTKINNVLIDNDSRRAVCVIDLDTVMPGSVLYDFGDQVRTTAGQFAENETDHSKVVVNLEVYEQLAKGYLSVANEFLVDREIELLPFSGRLMTFTIGIRFLADYLDGDLYFKTSYPEENLDRARAQFAFVRSIEENIDAMEKIIARYTAA